MQNKGIRQKTDLDSLELALLRAKLAAPRCLRVCVCLDARLELVELFPLVIQLLPCVADPFRKPHLHLAYTVCRSQAGCSWAPSAA